jgi:hypothetical protein
MTSPPTRSSLPAMLVSGIGQTVVIACYACVGDRADSRFIRVSWIGK